MNYKKEKKKKIYSTKEIKGIKINLTFIFNNFSVHRTGLRLVHVSVSKSNPVLPNPRDFFIKIFVIKKHVWLFYDSVTLQENKIFRYQRQSKSTAQSQTHYNCLISLSESIGLCCLKAAMAYEIKASIIINL